MEYDTMNVMQYNINYINIYEVRCDVMSVHLHNTIKLKLLTGTT